MTCPGCQHENRASAKFCEECGTPLQRPEGSAQPAPSYADWQRVATGAQEQQAATAEILRVISRSPTDIKPVLDAVVRSAMRLCESYDAMIMLREGEELHFLVHHGPIRGPVQLTSRAISPGWVAGRAFLDRQPVHVHDLATAGAEFPVGQADAVRAGYRTTLSVPLLREGEAIGVIHLRRREVRPFTDNQIALLQTFADQAVIAIENVRLFKELEARNRELTEALGRETATGDVLKVISRSAFDLEPVLENLVESARRLCGADRGHVYRLDGEFLRIGVTSGAEPEFKEYLQRNPIRLGPGSISGRAALERRAVHVHDVLTEPDYHLRERQRVGGYRTVLAVPMLREESLIGVITIWKAEVSPFTEKQIELVTTFADQAVIAIENVRLFTELGARNRDLTETLAQQTATSEILRVISSSPTDVQPVFATIVASSVRLCGAAYGSFHRFDGELLHLETIHNLPPEQWAALARRFPYRPGAETAIGLAIVERRVVRIDDILDEPSTPRREAAREILGYRAWLSVPVLRGDHALGVISIWRPEPGSFTDAQIALLQTFADQAVIAIENVRLFTELQEKNLALMQAHAQMTNTLEQQTATSEILGVISRSQTDVQPVFDSIARSAVRLCDGLFGAVNTFDGELLHAVALHHYTPDALAAVRRMYP